MGERGPAPTPIGLRLMEGTNHRPIDKDVVGAKLISSTPDCPEWIATNPKAAKEWNELVTLMGQVDGWLNAVNKTTLAGHCHWFAVWEEAEETLIREGRYYDTILGVDPEDGETSVSKKLHPLVKVSRDAWASMLKCDQELGITPARGSSTRVPLGDRNNEQGLDGVGA